MSLFRFPKQRPSAPYQLLNDGGLRYGLREYNNTVRCIYDDEYKVRGTIKIRDHFKDYGVGVYMAHQLGRILAVYDLVGLINDYRDGFLIADDFRYDFEFPASDIRDAVLNWDHGVNYYKVKRYLKSKYDSTYNSTGRYIKEGKETLGIPVRAQVFM